MLLAMWSPATPEHVAKACDAPLFRVRSAVREFIEAGFVEEKEGTTYVVTIRGVEKMEA
jgi:predicted transcriptional regulator